MGAELFVDPSPLFVGADPGADCGLVALDAHGRFMECARLDHDDGTATRDWLEERRDRIVIVGLEHSRPFRGNGVIGAFGLGRRFEQIRMACVCLRIPVMLVHAQTWQATAGFSRPSKVTAADLDQSKYASDDPAEREKLQAKAERAGMSDARADAWREDFERMQRETQQMRKCLDAVVSGFYTVCIYPGTPMTPDQASEIVEKVLAAELKSTTPRAGGETGK